MPGNAFGHLYRVTTFGESHGPAIGGVIDGIPSNIPIDISGVQKELDRRRPGANAYLTQRREADRVEFLSGIHEGKTLGTPIGFTILNEQQKEKDYRNLEGVYRPGHADYAYQMKYGFRDHRGGGRSSGRETASRVVAGAIAKQYLMMQGVHIRACVIEAGIDRCAQIDWSYVSAETLFAGNAQFFEQIKDSITKLREQGDSMGALIQLEAFGLPAGLGEPVFQKLDAMIGQAMFGIGGVKGVEIGDGMSVSASLGSQSRDAMTSIGFTSNHAGGILGGISTGQNLSIKIAVKPPSSIRKEIATLKESGEETTVSVKGRHDTCIGIRVVPVAEAMLACVLLDALLMQRRQEASFSNSDIKEEECDYFG